MTTELMYLILTMMLISSLWIPYIVGVTRNLQTDADTFVRPAPLSGYPAWVHRAHRAHLNALETALPFAVLILMAHMLGVSTWVTIWASALFFWVRLVHAIGMISGWAKSPLRPILFNLGWLSTLAVAIQLLLA